MKLTILGNRGSYPRPGDACSGYLLEDGKTKIILDLGSGCLANLLSVAKPEELTAVICSHLHFDHISDLFVLQYALQETGKKLLVYAPATPKNTFDMLSNCSNFDVKPIMEETQLKLGNLDVSFKLLEHGVDNYAMKFNDGKWQFMYTGDTCKCKALETFLEGVQTVLCDCNVFEDQHSNKHLSLYEACDLCNQAKVRHLIMTHFNPAIRSEKYLQLAAARFNNRVSKADILKIINI